MLYSSNAASATDQFIQTVTSRSLSDSLPNNQLINRVKSSPNRNLNNSILTQSLLSENIATNINTDISISKVEISNVNNLLSPIQNTNEPIIEENSIGNSPKFAHSEMSNESKKANSLNNQQKQILISTPVALNTFSLSSSTSSASSTSSTSSFASTSLSLVNTPNGIQNINSNNQLNSTSFANDQTSKSLITSTNEQTTLSNNSANNNMSIALESSNLNTINLNESDKVDRKNGLNQQHSQTSQTSSIQSSNPQTPVISNMMSSSNSFLNAQPTNTSNCNTNNPSPDTFRKSLFGSLRESTYKKQKENYLTEKKRITNDILTIMRDESIIVLADWLKVRGSLKNWIKLYVILKPGIMLLFKSDKMKPGQWVGTILLNSCQLLERPSKKHGFCFKIFHPLERSIWASKGPAGENYINVPYMLLPTFYLIFRAPSNKIGSIWMEAIELALKSSHLLKPSPTNLTNLSTQIVNNSDSKSNRSSVLQSSNSSAQNGPTTDNNAPKSENKNLEASKIKFSTASLQTTSSQQAWPASQLAKDITILTNLNGSNDLLNHIRSNSNCLINSQDNEIETKHFKEIGDNVEDGASDSDNGKNSSDEVCSLNSSNNPDDEFYEDGPAIVDQILSKTNAQKTSESFEEQIVQAKETKYVVSAKEEFGELGNKGQTEEVGEENKSLIFCLVKQVRPGMDLSKVVLPTFILEPRSFLEKLTDYYYHSNILHESINNDDPYERMKSVVKFYLSGFYKKPKGLKKPYNPILGELFRCYWYNPESDSKTFYIAEQVSHHPPITSFYVTNRKEGFCIYGTVLARSKFYGNSVSAIMDGNVKLILLNRGEEYTISLPYANCKGILIGKLTMELGGKVNIECAKTGYSTEIEFKLKPLLGGIEASNLIEGKIKFAKETIAVLHGKWDGEITIQEKRGEPHNETVLWNPTKQLIESRLNRFVVPFEDQSEFESEKLWCKVSEAIRSCDQNLATEEKTKIELKQRENDVARRSKFIEYKSKFFTYDNLNKEWLYNYSDLRPWDNQTDLFQYESDFRIFTKTKHNLNKINNKTNSDPRTSLLALQSPHMQRRSRHRTESNIVQTTDYISTNESYDLLVQYNDIKQRLDQIEDNLKQINCKFDPKSEDKSENIVHKVSHKSLIDNGFMHNKNSGLISNAERSHFSNFLKSPIMIIALIAWIFGLLTAIFSRKLVSLF